MIDTDGLKAYTDFKRLDDLNEVNRMSYKEDVKVIKALADENRLAILELLQDGEKCACVILEALNITQPTLSHHMKILCESGLVEGCKAGKWMHYSLAIEGSKNLEAIIQRYILRDQA